MNIFKKQNYPKVVEEIHNEFFQASKNLLIEARNILEKSKTKVISKGLRLLSLGFKKTSQSSEAEKVKVSLTLSKKDKEYVFYYRKNYPFSKFITEAQVKRICFKYNLVCGNVTLFKGFVPERNLIEIENFKGVKDKDSVIFEITENQNNTVYPPGLLLGLSKDDFKEPNYIEFMHGSKYYDPFNGEYDKVGLADTSLKICAPIKDMDTKGMKITKGFKLIKISPPDPIVLQPVKGGYLIITAWGDEASDPDVINPINN